MSYIVVTNDVFVNLPQESSDGALNSVTYPASGTAVVLSDAAYASLSPTAFTSGKIISGGQDVGGFGYKVERATATVPQTATENIFTISGGRVLLTGLWGEVTTAVGATVTTLAVVFDPTDAGANQTIGAAGAITSAAVGSVATIAAGTVAVTLNYGTDPVDLMLKPGALAITTSANNTGSIKWTATYRPIDAGAALVAA